MQFKGMGEIDLELHLLAGEKLTVDNIDIVPYTVREVMQYGYDAYIQNIQWISLSVDDFIKLMDDKGKQKIANDYIEELKSFDFYLQLGGEELQDILIKSLSMILRTDDIQIIENKCVVIDYSKITSKDDEFKIITRDNFDIIVGAIKYQNYIERDFKKNSLVAANDETAELMRQMELNRKKVSKKKKSKDAFDPDDEGITIAQIISSVSAKSNSINKFNIWDLTLYQLYDEFGRLEMIDNYEISIKAMMAGAENIQLSHWSNRLK